MRPVISVVVPALNEERVLGTCLSALRQQSLAALYEVLVVDNASTDATGQIAADHGCRVIYVPVRGQLLAKCAGVLAAEADLFAILDADCVPPRDWLSNVYRALNSPDGIGPVAVTCCYRFVKLPWWGRIYVFLTHSVLVGAYRLFLRTMPFVIGGNVASCETAVSKGGGYPATGGIAQTELGLARLLNQCGRIRYLPEMEVCSSTRRFGDGAFHFFVRYKLFDYLIPYLRRKR